MRTRTRTTVASLSSTYTQQELVSGVYTWNATTLVPSVGTSQLIIDESDGAFSKAKRDSRVLMRPVTSRKLTRKKVNTVFHRESKRVAYPGGQVNAHFIDDGTNLSAYTYLSDYMLTPADVGNPDHAARRDRLFPFSSEGLTLDYRKRRLLEEVYADAGQSEALVPVSIAEFGKTLTSIGRLRSLIPRFRQWILKNEHVLLTKRSAFRLSGEMARQWLEYRFGFMQLYYDLKSLDKAFGRIGKKYVKYSSRRVIRSSLPVIMYENTYPTDIDNVTVVRERTDIITAGVVLEAYPTSLDAVRALGLDKPLTTMWELTRLSWVVDRFINVSQMLAAWEGALIRNVQGSWVSCRTDIHASYSFRRRGRTYLSGDTLVQDVGTNVQLTDTEDYTQYVREANPPYPWLLPELQLKLNFAGALDLVALLRGLSTTLSPKR